MKPSNSLQSHVWPDKIWNIWCIASLIGIWPQFIEPQLLTVSRIPVSIPTLPKGLQGVKILQFSDLHWSQNFSARFASKILRVVQKLSPDIIVFTGDFLCRSRLDDADRLRSFLCSFQASLGIFAVFGNHDYQEFVTVNEKGDYDVERKSNFSPIQKGLARLLGPLKHPTKAKTASALHVGQHSALEELLKKSPFKLLHNQTVQIQKNGCYLNICGLGEYTTGHFNPKKAFEQYNLKERGIVLSHNPDSAEVLKKYPGELILSGHTHGGQVNLPWMWRKFTVMENSKWKSGRINLPNKTLYVNRGLGSVLSFRWFSPPELTLITLS